MKNLIATIIAAFVTALGCTTEPADLEQPRADAAVVIAYATVAKPEPTPAPKPVDPPGDVPAAPAPEPKPEPAPEPIPEAPTVPAEPPSVVVPEVNAEPPVPVIPATLPQLAPGDTWRYDGAAKWSHWNAPLNAPQPRPMPMPVRRGILLRRR